MRLKAVLRAKDTEVVVVDLEGSSSFIIKKILLAHSSRIPRAVARVFLAYGGSYSNVDNSCQRQCDRTRQTKLSIFPILNFDIDLFFYSIIFSFFSDIICFYCPQGKIPLKTLCEKPRTTHFKRIQLLSLCLVSNLSGVPSWMPWMPMESGEGNVSICP